MVQFECILTMVWFGSIKFFSRTVPWTTLVISIYVLSLYLCVPQLFFSFHNTLETFSQLNQILLNIFTIKIYWKGNDRMYIHMFVKYRRLSVHFAWTNHLSFVKINLIKLGLKRKWVNVHSHVLRIIIGLMHILLEPVICLPQKTNILLINGSKKRLGECTFTCSSNIRGLVYTWLTRIIHLLLRYYFNQIYFY